MVITLHELLIFDTFLSTKKTDDIKKGLQSIPLTLLE